MDDQNRVTNKDLFEGAVSIAEEDSDNYCVIADEPQLISGPGERVSVTIDVQLDHPAAWVPRFKKPPAPKQPLVSRVRTEENPGWLIGNGALLFGREDEFACFLRNAGAADSFNIATLAGGRLNGRVGEHTRTEVAEEVVLLYVDTGYPKFARFHEKIEPPIHDIRETFGFVPPFATLNDEVSALEKRKTNCLQDVVKVRWLERDGSIAAEDESVGLAFVDRDNWTLEMRQTLKLPANLVRFLETDIGKGGYDDVTRLTHLFSGEGTGFAVWSDIDSLIGMQRARHFQVVPLLQEIVRRVSRQLKELPR